MKYGRTSKEGCLIVSSKMIETISEPLLILVPSCLKGGSQGLESFGNASANYKEITHLSQYSTLMMLHALINEAEQV